MKFINVMVTGSTENPLRYLNRTKWFAWHPVKLVTGGFAWLTHVYKIVDDSDLVYLGLHHKTYYEPDIENIIDLISKDEEFIENVCLSYDHEYGLMKDNERRMLRFEYKEWMRAIKNNYPYK